MKQIKTLLNIIAALFVAWVMAWAFTGFFKGY